MWLTVLRKFRKIQKILKRCKNPNAFITKINILTKKCLQQKLFFRRFAVKKVAMVYSANTDKYMKNSKRGIQHRPNFFIQKTVHPTKKLLRTKLCIVKFSIWRKNLKKIFSNYSTTSCFAIKSQKIKIGRLRKKLQLHR